MAAALLYGSCVGSPPSITRILQTVVFRHDPAIARSFESLYLYTLVHDVDGIGDVSELYILNDDQSIFWKLDQSNWDSIEIDDQVWIGSHVLRMPQSRVIPRGQYRIQVYDRGGETDTEEIEVFQSNTIDNVQTPFPSLTYRDGVLTLISDYDDNIVRWHHPGGNEAVEYVGGAGEIRLGELAPQLNDALTTDNTFISSSSFYIYSFSADDIDDYYVLVGPITI